MKSKNRKQASILQPNFVLMNTAKLSVTEQAEPPKEGSRESLVVSTT